MVVITLASKAGESKRTEGGDGKGLISSYNPELYRASFILCAGQDVYVLVPSAWVIN